MNWPKIPPTGYHPEYRKGFAQAVEECKEAIPSVEEIAEAIPFRCVIKANKNIRLDIATAINNLMKEASRE